MQVYSKYTLIRLHSHLFHWVSNGIIYFGSAFLLMIIFLLEEDDDIILTNAALTENSLIGDWTYLSILGIVDFFIT